MSIIFYFIEIIFRREILYYELKYLIITSYIVHIKFKLNSYNENDGKTADTSALLAFYSSTTRLLVSSVNLDVIIAI